MVFHPSDFFPDDLFVWFADDAPWCCQSFLDGPKFIQSSFVSVLMLDISQPLLFQIFLLPCSLFLLWFSLCDFYMFWDCLTVLRCSACTFYSFSTLHLSRNFVLTPQIKSSDETKKAFFIFITILFISSITFGFFLLASILLLTLPIWFCMWSILFHLIPYCANASYFKFFVL